LVRFVPISSAQPFIVGLVTVATKGHLTKGRLQWPPSRELCRSRKSANDVLVVGRSKLASFDHLIGARHEQTSAACQLLEHIGGPRLELPHLFVATNSLFQ
jgi:hypothetical protein